ncbi:nucleotidyltransferase family protein [Leptotrichia sp. oral taxon 417]|uniref:tRNA(Met) cytidine acetate ligase n=1 Tax=Leptotrichia TaxID=32067 RepID=UPI0015BEEFC0|nr:nucleotidyltransferase family protein [Leptotrichia sp. oral taxon 417]NWO28115.1 nucleotidyltransferase family protein [Leptotrichia sp. oral taxon 417]
MLKIGIVAEYNPFHNGHLYQIRKIREIFGKDVFIAVVGSGDFVQRGEISFLDKWEKTQVNLECGVNLVAELPLYYSIQNAEIFSKMATRILDYLGMDIQVFGAEEENIEVLQKVLDLQKRQDYKDKLMGYMKKGNSYSTSQRLALKEYELDGIVKSNNILALEYMREIEKSNLGIKPFIVKREISEYNEEKVEKEREEFASASFLRNELEKILEEFCGDKNLKSKKLILEKLKKIQKFVPEKSFEIILENLEFKIKNGINFQKLKEEIFKIVKYKILTEKKEKIMEIYDINCEIYARIYKGAEISKNYREFLENTKSRNLSNRRVERIILNILLNIKAGMMDFEINYVRILGFDKKGQEYLKKIRENNNFEDIEGKNGFEKKNIFVNWKDIEKFGKFFENNGNMANSKNLKNLKNSENKNISKKENIKNFKIQENFFKKIKIEKNGFLLKELFLGKKEKLNPIVYLNN